MPVKLHPDDRIKPLEMQVELRLGDLTHAFTFRLETPALLGQFEDAVIRNFYNEFHTFLETSLQPAATDSPPRAVAPTHELPAK